MRKIAVVSVVCCAIAGCQNSGEDALESQSSALQAEAGAGWILGAVGSTPQNYPADFNVFAFGNVGGFQDARGPVAAGGKLNLTSFSLNGGAGKPVALVVGSDLTLRNGTVTGAVIHGGSKSLNGVTINGTVTAGSPIDFAAARTKLRAMSQTLKDYRVNGTTSVASWGDISFISTDARLNVFTVDQTALAKATSIILSVPPTSTVVINVTGTAPSIRNCGFTLNGHDRGKILWNFHQAQTFTTASVQFPGSALAPYAAANLSWGAFDGTLVAESVDAKCEFHWFPFKDFRLLALATLRSPGNQSSTDPYQNPLNYVNFGEKNLRFTWEPDATAVSYRLVVLVPSSLYSIFYKPVCDKPNLTVGTGLGQDADGHVYYQFTNDDCPTRDIVNEYWPGYPVHAWYVEETGSDGTIRRSEWFYYYGKYPRELSVPAEYPTIQSAIDAATDYTRINISDGTYAGAGNKNLHWDGNSKHLTVRCTNGPANCIIDSQKDGRGFTLNQGQDARDIIQGITIKNGWVKLPINQTPPYDLRGGGAILADGTSPQILGCILRDNIAGDTEGVITNSFYADGGAINVVNGGRPIIRANHIEANYASHTGGGIAIAEAGASIENNLLLGNFNRGCYGGGAISIRSSATTLGFPRTEVVNNVIARNSTEYYATRADLCHGGFGGGITLQNSDAHIVNNTIVANNTKLRNPTMCQGHDFLDGEGGGVRIAGEPYPVLQNNIIRDNQSGAGTESLGIATVTTDPIEVTYSNIQGGTGSIISTQPETNIDVDPGFTNAAANNFDLLATSACIDKGTVDWPVSVRFYDLAGRPRRRAAAFDMGAFEFFK